MSGSPHVAVLEPAPLTPRQATAPSTMIMSLGGVYTVHHTRCLSHNPHNSFLKDGRAQSAPQSVPIPRHPSPMPSRATSHPLQ